MKKLNITKKQYDESKYFTKKYGAIKFVSESGKHYKTDKGVVLALEGTEEPMKEDGDSIMDRQLDGNEEADKKDGGDNEGDITRGELTDMLKDVVKEVEKVCDAQDLSFEEVAGIEKPEGESDEAADKDEVVATKDEVAEVLAGVIDTVEKVADQNDIELPEEDDDEEKKDDDDGEVKVDDPEKEDECTVTEESPKTDAPCDDKLEQIRKILTDEDLSADAMVAEIGELVGGAQESCDCGKKGCPDCNPDVVKGECGGKDKFMEARKARRAKLVREAIRRLRAKKVRESVVRRAKVRKVLESIRKRRLAKKVMESIRRRRAAKKVMESRKARVLAARKNRKVMESVRARRAARMRRLAK